MPHVRGRTRLPALRCPAGQDRHRPSMPFLPRRDRHTARLLLRPPWEGCGRVHPRRDRFLGAGRRGVAVLSVSRDDRVPGRGRPRLADLAALLAPGEESRWAGKDLLWTVRSLPPGRPFPGAPRTGEEEGIFPGLSPNPILK